MEMVLALVALLIAVAALFFASNLLQQNKELVRKVEALELASAMNQQSIQGLTSGAVGVDNRLRRMEAQEKLLTERQDTIENQQVEEQPYGNAIRLVQQGASKERLIDELELSESEADLIVRLHGAG